MSLGKSVPSMGKAQLDREYAARKKADAAAIKATAQRIDFAAQKKADPYRKKIHDTLAEGQKQYDTHALQEAVSRKCIEERMANMGLIGGGLDRSRQAAAAQQRRSADRASRQKETEAVQRAQSAIDEVYKQAAIHKQASKESIENATAKWYAAALARLPGYRR